MYLHNGNCTLRVLKWCTCRLIDANFLYCNWSGSKYLKWISDSVIEAGRLPNGRLHRDLWPTPNLTVQRNRDQMITSSKNDIYWTGIWPVQIQYRTGQPESQTRGSLFSFILGRAESNLHWSDEASNIHGYRWNMQIWDANLFIHAKVRTFIYNNEITYQDFVVIQQFHELFPPKKFYHFSAKYHSKTSYLHHKRDYFWYLQLSIGWRQLTLAYASTTKICSFLVVTPTSSQRW